MNNQEDEVGGIIDRCIARARPQVEDQIGYTRGVDANGEYVYYEDPNLISAYIVREELKHEIANYLRVKEAEINSRLVQAKCDAYELALTHSRPIEKLIEEEE